MKTTVDKAGRVVIPKKIREQARLVPGMQLDVRHHDGVIEIEPSPVEVKLVRKGRFFVLVPQGVVPPITDEDVEGIRQETEDERISPFRENGGLHARLQLHNRHDL
jgi:AbrB family looped-hinge helix DNA binding protein